MSRTELTAHHARCRACITQLWPARSKPAKRELIRICLQALRAINKSL